MQVRVYAVKTESGWHTGMTLDWRVDAGYWLSEEGGKRRGKKLVVLQPALPIFIGLAMLEEFIENEEMDQWGKRGWTKYYRDALHSYRELLYLFTDSDRHGEEEWFTVMILEAPDSEPNAQAVKEGRQEAYRVAESAAVYRLEERVTRRGPALERLPEAGGALRASLQTDAWQLAEALQGRLVSDEELVSLMEDKGWQGWIPLRHTFIQLGCLHGWLEVRAGIMPVEDEGKRWASKAMSRWRTASAVYRCNRCGSTEDMTVSVCASCGSMECRTCTHCLNLGRIRSCSLLVAGSSFRPPAAASGRAAREEELGPRLAKWGLAPAQEAASTDALQYIGSVRRDIERGRSLDSGQAVTGTFLLWAVTGAGKTEMIFPLIEDALLYGGRALVATPRRDVVLELKPRIEKAFPAERVVTLYGGSPERWGEGRITLATTHQLLRFDRAFDLVIIDELDAFPYHIDPMLHRAAERVCRRGGVFVFLSATPPEAMQRQVRRGTLRHARVPVRYHRHPLPVPARIAMPAVALCLARGALPGALLRRMAESVGRGAQVFIFITRIRQVDGVVRLLQRQFPEIRVEGTSAADAQRGDRVLRFRERDIRMLVTTTILERGVTVPKSDVYILDADDKLFDEASLVQMAGRAGRSKDDPAGKVVFGSRQWNRAQRRAVRQIRGMNRLARRYGYLLPVYNGGRWRIG